MYSEKARQASEVGQAIGDAGGAYISSQIKQRREANEKERLAVEAEKERTSLLDALQQVETQGLDYTPASTQSQQLSGLGAQQVKAQVPSMITEMMERRRTPTAKEDADLANVLSQIEERSRIKPTKTTRAELPGTTDAMERIVFADETGQVVQDYGERPRFAPPQEGAGFSTSLEPVGATSSAMVTRDRTGNITQTGQPVPRFKAQVPVIRSVSPGERTQLASYDSTVDSLKNISELYNESFVGPVAGRYGMAKDVLVGNEDKQSRFLAATAALKNSVIKMVTGAAMSDAEAARIIAQLPTAELPPSTWIARFNETVKNAERMRQTLEGRSGAPPLRIQVIQPTPFKAMPIVKKERIE
jgi:hypothetical protein